MYSDNVTQKVAEVAAKIMAEQLKGNQKKIDKNHNNKIDGQDFAILRGEKKANEEVGMNEEDAYSKDRYVVKNGKATKDNPTHMGSPNYKDQPHHVWATSPEHAVKKYMKKEEVEQIEEMDKSQDPPGRDGGYQFAPGPKVPKKDIEAIKKNPAKHLSDLFAKEYSKKKVKEEVEQIEEGIEDRIEAARAKAKAAGKTIKDKAPAPKSNVRKVEGHAYGGAKQKDEPEEDEDDTPAKKTVKYGARQNFVRSKRVNESFTEMLSAYKEEGLKFVADTLVVEEPTEEEFNAEIKKAQDKSEGKDKAEVAKASVQAVKNEEVEVIDADQINGVEEITIDERHMTDSEMNKREKIVKSMKKGLSGFKQRYGDRAKNVMYATATKQAMKD